MKLRELNKTPFGRSLHVLAHRLPRSSKQGENWELERGFHLEVLGDDSFFLTLGALRKDPDFALPIGQAGPRSGQEGFVIWHCPGRYRPARFEEFAGQVAGRQCTGLILSQSSERARALLDYPKYRGLWKQVDTPVLQVFQDFPDARFFTPEKCLADLGRIGRRLRKLGRIRRLLPF